MTQQEARRRIAQAKAEGWTELDLSDLGLEEVPKEIAQLSRLQELGLSDFTDNVANIREKLGIESHQMQ